MNKQIQALLMLGLLSFLVTGCTGVNVWQPFQQKPYTLLRGGDQLGRDQMANRLLATQNVIPMKGMDRNEVLNLLGQPQNISTVERNISEEWRFAYYPHYRKEISDEKAYFLVRFYHDKVIDVIKES